MSETSLPRPSKSEILGVRRYMEPKSQEYLARKASELSGVKLSGWAFRRLLGSDAFVPVLPEHRYESALMDPDGLLGAVGVDQSSRLLKHVTKNHRTASRPLSVGTGKTQVRSTRRGTHQMITWPMRTEALHNEIGYFHKLLKGLNQTPVPRDQHIPIMILAVLPAHNQISKVADAFEELRPQTLSLLGAEVLTAAEIRDRSQEADQRRDQLLAN